MSVPHNAHRPRVTARLAWIVLAAVVVGLAVGALACSASLARGSGHLAHAQPGTTAPARESHHGHVVNDTAPTEDPVVERADAPDDSGSGSIGRATEGHPGMACVVMVDLDVAESAIPLVSTRFDDARATAPGECIGDLDPPVPRSS